MSSSSSGMSSNVLRIILEFNELGLLGWRICLRSCTINIGFGLTRSLLLDLYEDEARDDTDALSVSSNPSAFASSAQDVENLGGKYFLSSKSNIVE